MQQEKNKNQNENIRLSVSNGFVILFAALFGICGLAGGIAVLCCAILHELAHLGAVSLCGGSLTALELRGDGFRMETSLPATVSYLRELFCLASGALANLTVGFLMVRMLSENEYIYILGGANIVTGLLNLVPAGRFDGGKIVRLCVEYAAGPQRARQVGDAISGLAALLVLFGGGLLFFRFGRKPLVAGTTLYLSFLLGYDIICSVPAKRWVRKRRKTDWKTDQTARLI